MKDAMEVIRTFWPIAATFLNVAFILGAFVLRKSFVSQKDFEALKRSHDQLQTQVSNLPEQEEITNLHIAIERLRGEINGIAPKLQSVEKISDLLLENEIKDK